MEWIRENRVFSRFFILMHFFVHGGCGRGRGDEKHEGHHGRDSTMGIAFGAQIFISLYEMWLKKGSINKRR